MKTTKLSLIWQKLKLKEWRRQRWNDGYYYIAKRMNDKAMRHWSKYEEAKYTNIHTAQGTSHKKKKKGMRF